MTELDGAQRLDPVLRALRRPERRSPRKAIGLMRGPFDQPRREAAQLTDLPGVHDQQRTMRPALNPGEFRFRIYRGGPSPARVGRLLPRGRIRAGQSDTDHRQCAELAAAAAARWCRFDYRWPGAPLPAALDDAIVVAEVGGRQVRRELDIDARGLARRGQQRRGHPGRFRGAPLHRRVAAVRRVPTAASAGARRSHHASKAEFRTSPAFDRESRGTDVALLPGPSARIAGCRSCAAQRITRFASNFDHLRVRSTPSVTKRWTTSLRLLHARVCTELHVFPPRTLPRLLRLAAARLVRTPSGC